MSVALFSVHFYYMFSIKIKKITYIFLLSIFFVTAFFNTLDAAINQEINYQARLLDSAGDPVVDGDYDIEFNLYTVSSGGSSVWSETQTVPVENGLFATFLGSSTALTTVDFNQTLYLGVDIESDGEMTPRKKLGVVSAAIVADTVDGISSEQFFRNDILNATSSATTSLAVRQNGTGNIADFIGSTGTSALRIASDGTVQLGTTSRTFVRNGNIEFEDNIQIGSLDTAPEVIIGDLTGNTRGSEAIDIQTERTTATRVASGLRSVAIGGQNTVSNSYGVGIGYLNTNSGQYANAIGSSNNTSGSYASAFGRSNTASASYATVVGSFNSATQQSATAIGYSNTSSGSESSALGFTNNASATNASAVGNSNDASGEDSVAFGFGNTASQINASAFGNYNNSSGSQSTAFGYANDSSGSQSTAFGYGNNSSGLRASAFGYGNLANATYATAFGYDNDARSSYAAAVGYSNYANSSYSSAFGVDNDARGNYSTAVGYSNFSGTSGQRNSLFGYNNTTSTNVDDSYVFGDTNTATVDGAGIVGANITNSTANSLELGPNNTAKVSILSTGEVEGRFFTADSTTATSTFPKLSATDFELSGIFYDGNNSAGTDGYVLQTTGSGVEWVATSSLGITGGGGGSPAGSDRQLQFNNGGSFGADANFVLTAAGKVGIGTASPSTTLSVIGTTTISGLLEVGSSSKVYIDNGKINYEDSIKIGSLDTNAAIIAGNLTGNARGTRAIDIQTYRTIATQVASGNYSTVVGNSSVASGLYGSAFGYNSKSTGNYTTSAGYSNTASGLYGSAFGFGNTSSNTYAATFGYSNQATDSGASALGVGNAAQGESSSAVGNSNDASSQYASAFGFNNTAAQDSSSAFGYNNTASNSNASAFGASNSSSGSRASTFGYANIASGTYSSALGYDNDALSSYVASLGYSNYANSSYSSALGVDNDARGLYSTAVGYSNYSGTSGLRNSLFGYNNTTNTSVDDSYVFGSGNTATVDGAGIVGANITNSTANSLELGPNNTAKVSILSTGEVEGRFFTADSTAATSTFPKLSATDFELSGLFLDSNGNAGGAGQVLQSTGSGVQWVATSTFGFASSTNMFYAFDSVGNINIISGWTDITLDTEVREDSNYTHGTDSAEITFNQDGWYEVSYNISTDVISGADRSTSASKLQENVGAGYIDIPGSRGEMYNRISNKGSTNASVKILREFESGDKIKLVASRTSGSDNIQTKPDSAGITIRFLDDRPQGGGAVFTASGSDAYYTAGNVGIGTNTPLRPLHVVRSDDGAPVRFEDSDGYCEINPTSSTWSCTSDARLKENVIALDDFEAFAEQNNSATSTNSSSGFEDEETTLDRLRKLRPVQFEWISDDDDAKRYGFIAQEVEEIFPELVNTDNDTGYKSVAYGGFVPFVIRSVQDIAEQQDGILESLEEIKDSIIALSNKIETLSTETIASVFGWMQFRNEKLCVDDVCINKEEFKQLIRNNGGTTNNEFNDIANLEDDVVSGPIATTTDDVFVDDNATSTDDSLLDDLVEQEDGTATSSDPIITDEDTETTTEQTTEEPEVTIDELTEDIVTETLQSEEVVEEVVEEEVEEEVEEDVGSVEEATSEEDAEVQADDAV